MKMPNNKSCIQNSFPLYMIRLLFLKAVQEASSRRYRLSGQDTALSRPVYGFESR